MKVSVVIPTYNREKLIIQTLKSVTNQSYQNLEIIVVSDGSTDNTDAILEEYKRKDPRIKYISYHPNRGGNYARNIGIKNATGNYIAFIDDDDEWVPEKIHLQMKEFKKDTRIGLVYTGAKITYEDQKISYTSIPKKTGDLSKEILISNYIGSTSRVIVKASVLDQSGMFDDKLKAQQDYDLWIRICQITHIGAVPQPLLIYNNFGSTLQVSDDIKKYEQSIKYIYKKYDVLYKETEEKIRTKHQQSCCMTLANKCLRNGEPKKARMYLLNHIKIRPSIKAFMVYLISYFNYNTILKLRTLKKY